MKKISFYLLLLALMPVMANAQDDDEDAMTIGINGGVDKSINAYQFTPDMYNDIFSNNKTYHNVALDFGLWISPKFRPRIELKYVQTGYTANWETPDYTSNSMKVTNVTLYNFDINLRMDYLLLKIKKFQVFVSPALKWEFNINGDSRNTEYDGSYDYKQYNGIITDSPNNIAGGAVSAIFKYKLNRRVGITLSPEYTLFFHDYVQTNNKLYQRISANFGLEFTL
jgi:hypothetical protein